MTSLQNCFKSALLVIVCSMCSLGSSLSAQLGRFEWIGDDSPSANSNTKFRYSGSSDSGRVLYFLHINSTGKSYDTKNGQRYFTLTSYDDSTKLTKAINLFLPKQSWSDPYFTFLSARNDSIFGVISHKINEKVDLLYYLQYNTVNDSSNVNIIDTVSRKSLFRIEGRLNQYLSVKVSFEDKSIVIKRTIFNNFKGFKTIYWSMPNFRGYNKSDVRGWRFNDSLSMSLILYPENKNKVNSLSVLSFNLASKGYNEIDVKLEKGESILDAKIYTFKRRLEVAVIAKTNTKSVVMYRNRLQDSDTIIYSENMQRLELLQKIGSNDNLVLQQTLYAFDFPLFFIERVISTPSVDKYSSNSSGRREISHNEVFVVGAEEAGLKFIFRANKAQAFTGAYTNRVITSDEEFGKYTSFFATFYNGIVYFIAHDNPNNDLCSETRAIPAESPGRAVCKVMAYSRQQCVTTVLSVNELSLLRIEPREALLIRPGKILIPASFYTDLYGMYTQYGILTLF
jgi:hypothetical protein